MKPTLLVSAVSPTEFQPPCATASWFSHPLSVDSLDSMGVYRVPCASAASAIAWIKDSDHAGQQGVNGTALADAAAFDMVLPWIVSGPPLHPN